MTKAVPFFFVTVVIGLDFDVAPQAFMPGADDKVQMVLGHTVGELRNIVFHEEIFSDTVKIRGPKGRRPNCHRFVGCDIHQQGTVNCIENVFWILGLGGVHANIGPTQSVCPFDQTFCFGVSGGFTAPAK